MADIKVPWARAKQTITIVRNRGTTTLLQLGDDRILFFDGEPIAVSTREFVYFNCAPGAEVRAAHDFAGDRPLVREPAEGFDYIIGQCLIQAGLPLTRRQP